MPDHTTTLEIERPTGDHRSAERWAREVLEGARLPVRLLLRIGWWCLGLRGRLAPERVLGWTVAEAHPARVALTMPSQMMTARNVVRVEGPRVRWITEIDFDRPAARLLWSLALPVHRLVIPARLRRVAATA